MTWVTGIMVYAITWWTVLFMVLPWGVRREDNPQPGHDPGAPQRPMLWRKVLATTLVTSVVWLVIFFIIRADLISFRPTGPVN